MKKISNGWIIAFSAAVLVATTGFGGCTTMGRYEKYDNADLYQNGNFTYAAADIKEVEIDWVLGSVEIVQSDAAELSVSEESIKDVDKQLHYYLEGTTLKIKFCKSGLRTNIEEKYKNLRVEIPSSVYLEIDSVSAPITIGEATLSGLSVETVSGDLIAEKINTPAIEIETVSGELSIGLTEKSNVEIETVSGDMVISLLNNRGATIVFDEVSGKFLTEREYGKAGKKRYDILGEAQLPICTIDIESVSGDLTVK